MVLGIKPTVDFVFKKVFGSPENVSVLIRLLNAILKLDDPIVHVEILNPFSYQEFADDKLIVLDIRARDSAGRWLNIEMQVTVFVGLLQRLVYYASEIEQWAFFLLFADRYEAQRLRELLPGIEFQQAISVVEAIAEKTEDRMIYDQRLKAQRDYQWGLDSARQEGREEGREEGAVMGKIQLLQELLGEASSSTASLRERTMGELSTMLADLQQRLRSREL